MEHEGEPGKTECWYVIEKKVRRLSTDNAKSKKESVSKLEDKNWDAFADKKSVPVKAGDFFMCQVTMHAILESYPETQQSSDTTTVFMIFLTARMLKEISGTSLGKFDWCKQTSVSQQTAIQIQLWRWSSYDYLGCKWFSPSMNWLKSWFWKDRWLQLVGRLAGEGKINCRCKKIILSSAGSSLYLPSDVESWLAAHNEPRLAVPS